MRHVLALDQGTTSSRAIIFDETGNPVASASQEFKQHYPEPGWVEHDPDDLWRSQRDVAREVLRSSGLKAEHLVACGITNQRETTLVWDRQTGKPVYPAIVWQDRRTAARCAELKEVGAGSLVQERTGLVLDPYFSATKVAWILERIPNGRRRAELGELAFGTVDTWLIWNLSHSKTHVTDVTNASRTMLFNIHMGDWDPELLQLFGVPRAMLPDVYPSSHAFGMIAPTVLGAPVPITGVAGDQQAALFGQGCHRAGMAKNTYGTGCFMLMHTGDRVVKSSNGLLSTTAAQLGRAVDARDVERQYALEGSVFIGGAVVQWLRDELKFFGASSDIERLASDVLDNGGVYVVPAFAGLGAPHWDPHARGAIFGLTRGSSRAHIARAALESIAYQSADLLDAMQKDTGEKLSELRVDGGAAANDMLMQFQANILGMPVVRPKVLETTALGAAYLAGLYTDVWKSREEIAAQWQMDRRFTPQMPREEAARLLARWHEAVKRSLAWSVD